MLRSSGGRPGESAFDSLTLLSSRGLLDCEDSESKANAFMDFVLGNHDRGRSAIGPVLVRANENLWGVSEVSGRGAEAGALSVIAEFPFRNMDVSSSKSGSNVGISRSKLGMSKDGRVGNVFSLNARWCLDDGL
jgi:hypothetical protein